jgi:hypothetical protein
LRWRRNAASSIKNYGMKRKLIEKESIFEEDKYIYSGKI